MRYAKRDTVGSAGSNMGMSLEVFAPWLVKYVGDAKRPVCTYSTLSLLSLRRCGKRLRISTCCESGWRMSNIARRSVSSGRIVTHAADFFTNEAEGEDFGLKYFVEKLTEFSGGIRAAGRAIA
jgi:hypothetical protein